MGITVFKINTTCQVEEFTQAMIKDRFRICNMPAVLLVSIGVLIDRTWLVGIIVLHTILGDVHTQISIA